MSHDIYARKMRFVQALSFLKDTEEVRSLCGCQTRCSQTSYKRPLSGESPFAFPDMPPDHLKFGFCGSHEACIT